MKELCGTSSNTLIALYEDKSVACAEVVLVVSEPQYKIDSDQTMQRYRDFECLRFTATVQGIGKLVLALIEIKDQLQKIQEQFGEKKE